MLRVGYVPEHFASPLLQYADADQDKTFVLSAFPGGTGAMTSALKNDEIDVAVALTDALIAGIANGSQAYRLVGSYVSTPLNWAVVTGKDSKYQSIDDLRGTKLGISRIGSGSQTMASVMAMQKNWTDKDGQIEMPEFQVNNNLQGLNASINHWSDEVVLFQANSSIWTDVSPFNIPTDQHRRFTTKPHVDSGEVRFIGSVPTPWPSWLIAAHPERAKPAALRNFLETLTEYVTKFDSDEQRAQVDVDLIRERFGYPEADIRAWLKTVRWVENCATIPGKVIMDTLSILEKARVVKRPSDGFNVEDFINSEVVRLV
ncbi:Periplasmic binding protein-like II [Rhizoctonia solani]|uniref:Periplasmic binding protein-like II n=1 Tax=Rhizoctonia solani TaxID=456999 RepID=A0A8H7M3X2_9AGAM|nr:Periplasmic binding protein-like II [Rhizoctonia solani]